MSACVYICYNCPSCDRVVEKLEEEHPEVKIVNVQAERPNIPRVQIFPALYVDQKLIAYGDDIITKLSA